MKNQQSTYANFERKIVKMTLKKSNLIHKLAILKLRRNQFIILLLSISDTKETSPITVKDNKKEKWRRKGKNYLVSACGDCAFYSRGILVVPQYPSDSDDGFLSLPYFVSCKFTVQYLNRDKRWLKHPNPKTKKRNNSKSVNSHRQTKRLV